MEIHTSRDLGGGTAMRYSLTPPLVLEAAYLAARAPVDLPVILLCLPCDWCACLDLFFTWLLRCRFTLPLVERLIIRCTMVLRLAPGLFIFGSAHTSIVC